MSLVSVVIPVYKSNADWNEVISFNQCLKVLSNYPVSIVTHIELDISYYIALLDKAEMTYTVEYFNPLFFKNLTSYNRLLLSDFFYTRFQQYDYILIYQLDAYVFEDKLFEWCNAGFDYIGAPTIGNWQDQAFSKTMSVGNGGFSLRKVSAFVAAFKYKQNVLSLTEIVKRNAVFKKLWTRGPLLLLMLLGYRNKFSYFAGNWKYNEDDFWSKFLMNSNFSLSKPSPEKAMEFAFERFPSKLFDITGKLPFGCHAWEKYEYGEFWKKYIHE